jgi:hypothetical protein
MRIGRETSLGLAARHIERKLLIAAQEGAIEDMDRLLDLLRSLAAIEDLEAPGPREVVRSK